MEAILQHMHEEQAFNKSEMIIDHCSKMNPPEGLEQFKFRIAEHFYNSKVNTPLIINEILGDDLQCMLAYWIKDHKLHNKDLILPYFVEHENQNYYFAIYYILIELRSVLNIAQKVDLEGEKLKQYFQYWLSLCSRELQNQFFGDAKLSYKRIIIILDGVDKFRDQNGEVRVSSWLPKVFPENIKLILTLRPESKAYEYYQNQGYLIMPVDTENDELLLSIRGNPIIFKAYTKLPQSLQKQTQFVKYFYSLLSNQTDEYINVIKEILTQLDQKINTDEDFYKIIVNAFIKIFQDQTYQSILSLLSIVTKGVNVEELCSICSCDIQQFQIVLNFFNICLMEQNGIYLIYILSFKSAISSVITVSKSLQQSLLTVLEHSQNTIRKLEELIYHYGKQKIYFKLKEVIVNVENFLILWNPHNKFELCHHWQILESNGYDLVLEYNKAVENFIALYKPSSESLFFIMVQICRFLREFSNFENHNTPTYKHPELRGQTIEFEEIGLYNELKSLKMISKKKKKNQLIPNVEYFTNNEQINPETLNIEIKSNKVLFINYYTNQLDQELIQEYIINKKEQLVERILKDQREQQIYYYKRWIWVQFPWLALTAKYNFSNLIQSYSKDSTSSMSIQEETQINQKAIKLVNNAKLQKQIDRSFLKNKLPSLNASLRIRTFSPVEKIEKTQKRDHSANSDKKTQPLFPLIKDRQTQKKLDQITYQKYASVNNNSNLLKNRLKDLHTIQQNMYPQEISLDAQRYLDVIKEYQDELKKQQEQLSEVFQQMKRINIVVKLCTNNSDYNEEQAQQLGKHSKNLDKLINDQKLVIKEAQESIILLKNKQKQENIRQKNEKKKNEKIEKSKQEITRFSFSNRDRIASDTSQYIKSNRLIVKFSPMHSSTNHFKFKPLKNTNILNSNCQENEEHILEQYKQLEDVGLHYVEDNTNLQDLIWSIQKQKELQNQINDNQDILNQLKRKQLKNQTLLKILQKNDIPSKYEEKPVYDIEGMRKNTDTKINLLKKLNIQRAAYYFFLKNIFSRVPNHHSQNIRGLLELLQPLQQQQHQQ